jgi:hypothetical protein
MLVLPAVLVSMDRIHLTRKFFPPSSLRRTGSTSSGRALDLLSFRQIPIG